jgi:tRNA A37 N6-isopentenylltransferase MiaA
VEYLHGRRTATSVAEAITIGTRQYAKRQQTWFRHQLGGRVITLDATRPPESGGRDRRTLEGLRSDQIR